MSGRLKLWALPALVAGLFWGSAALAQGTAQSADVAYALTLIDAGDAGTNDSRTGGPVTAATKNVRIKVTVSIPRTEGSSRYGGVPIKANPVRLMYRRHKGPGTAFDGSVALTRDAPYSAAGTALKSAFYPMPQAGADGLSVLDPTQLNYTAVVSGAAANVAGTDYTSYVGFGMAHDPARWESTFLSTAAYDITDPAALATTNPMIASLLAGEATYEWYAASRYGLGSFARISDIEDLGRWQTFTDVRLWEPLATEASNNDAALVRGANAAIPLEVATTLGTVFEWRLRAMPERAAEDAAWHVYRGTIGSNYMGQAGVQLLNLTGGDGTTYADYARVESPVFPDGVASVSFEALTSSMEDDSVQQLLVQVKKGSAWENVKTVDLQGDFRSYEVTVSGAEGGSTQIRLVRTTQLSTVSAANMSTVVIRNLVVRSAAPQAAFGKPIFNPVYPAYSTTDETGASVQTPITISFAAQGGNAAAPGTDVPRGYDAELLLRRRAEGDTTRVWRKVPVTVNGFSETSGNATLAASLAPETLITSADGSVNVEENAFFMSPEGMVTGVLPGVYDLALDYRILGSFKAGRSLIDEREAVEGRATTYDVEVMGDAGVPVVQPKPYLLNYREQTVHQEQVFLRVMYRTGTTDSSAPYALKTLDIPLLPSPSKADLWRVDVSRVLRLEDSSAVYAWGYDPTATDPDAELITQTGYLAFTVGAELSDGSVTWFGQKAVAAPGVMPATTSAVPAVSETLAEAASEADAVPLVVSLSDLPNSHLMVELAMPATLGAGLEATARLCGSYWQDFNTWYAPSDNFTETDFREDVSTRTADFNCTVTTDEGGSAVTAGWIPDEGPLAQTTSFTETFEVGRAQNRGLSFYMKDLASIASYNFAVWGAASQAALPKYLREDGDEYNYYSKYLEFGDAAEVVLNRTYSLGAGGRYSPDAQIRLRGTGNGISPREDANREVVLNGVGTVSFRLGLSIPYDIDHRVQLLSSSDDLWALNGFGLAAGVQFNRPAETCAASGYSVSYFLEDSRSTKKFELRVTQIVSFNDTDERERPENSVVTELYQWNGANAVRLPITDMSGNAIQAQYVALGNSMAGNAYGLWVMPDGRLAVGTASTATPTSLNIQYRSKDVVASTSQGYILSLGSAECRPIFRQALRATGASQNFTGAALSAITPAEVSISEPAPPVWAGSGLSWTLASDSSSSARIQVTRRTPSAELAGKVRLRAKRSDGGKETSPRTVSTDKTGSTFTVTMGAPNATLIIAPADKECNVFIDNITVSSWCGNDNNRNGNSMVPLYTNGGFVESNGFAGVGVWIRPEDDDQLNVAAADYNGRQCVLLQRSRQNTSTGLSGETTTSDIKNTGSSLALYMPYSEEGFGTVSFRYRIPSEDEYGNAGELPSVYVMLQYLADPSYYNNFLGNDVPSGWRNVSAPLELRNSAGVWTTASITPKLDGAELVGTKGTLRLVMVTDNLAEEDDPYVYIDDLKVTNNASGTLASWSARNVKLTDTPVSALYWKDRSATDVVPEEETFAEKSSLTRALQFNNVTSGTDTDGTYDTCVVDSPLLENGVGRVTFAARLTEPQSSPMRIYILATTMAGEADQAVFKPVTYVEVPNTVYSVFDVDLSKYTTYYTKPNADGTPGDSNTTDPFTCSTIRRIRLRAYLEGDGVDNDGFGSAAENRTPPHGRVLMDCLSVADPIRPSLRVESVAFSNVAGSDAASEFDRNAPLSQPVANAPLLRTMVELGHAQLLKDDSIRVFITLNPQDITQAASLVKTYRSDYTYTDVLGNTLSASATRPIHAWDAAQTDKWPVSAWFDLDAALQKVDPANSGTLSLDELRALGLANTVELHRGAGYAFFGDLTKLGLNALPANSLVQYTAWAVYQSAESDQWYATQIEPTDYTDFPWYFPRGLNAEIQARAGQGANFFSPYYWVYSCIPGEVFLNEIDLRDNGAAGTKMQSFVELCAPAGLDLGGWQVRATSRNSFEFSDGNMFIVPDGTTLLQPDVGAVPAMRKGDTASNRSFYTAFSNDSEVFYRAGGAADGEKIKDLTAVASTTNGGVAVRDFEYENLGGGAAVSLLLLRPTGGAEHIVVFSMANEGAIEADETNTYQKAIDSLYDRYRTAYASNGFVSEWYQTFLDGGWDVYGLSHADAFGAIALKEKNLTQVQAHGRRLTKANYFPTAGTSADNRFKQNAATFAAAQDYARSAYANSLATVDMGGMWVTRKNALDTNEANGPLDLTALCFGTWPAGWNPTETPRLNEPVPTTPPAGAAAPYTQVTPRQINPDQYLVKYRELSQSTVVSTLLGNGLGYHTLELYAADGATVSETRRGGRNTPITWALELSVPKVTLTYSALAFQRVSAVELRLIDAKTGDPEKTAAAKIAAQIPGAVVASGPDAEGWVTLTVPAAAKVFAIEIALKKPGAASDEDRYNVEARGTFAANPDATAKDVITKVSPFCGGSLSGSGRYQPWWGSGFGFAVDYDAAAADGAELTSFIVTYPSPLGLKEAGDTWLGLQAPWAGLTLTYTPTDADGTPLAPVTASLSGLEYEAAIEQLNTVFGPRGRTRYVELKTLAEGHAEATSAVGILSDTYAAAVGYNPDDTATFVKKEPAIPFCVWGVYTTTIQADSGNQTVSFVMPQAAPGEKAGIFEQPAWYQPLADLNAGRPAENTAPYFYLYSTPPQAAWLNELNLSAGASGSAPYAEVVMPVLRAGILNATPNVPQTTNHGWSVRRYTQAGAQAAEVSLLGVTPVASNSSSYTYNTIEAFASVAAAETSAYVLIRPCGAAEGGVWAGVDASGGTAVPPVAGTWLADVVNTFVVAGKTDASGVNGSVQLVGRTIYDDDGFRRISSAVADRTEWSFAAETKNGANEGISPDTKPEWNQVTVTSALRNSVYGGVLCGYQKLPGYFDADAVSGVASTEGAVTLTLGGADWVYAPETGKTVALSFRPRSTYRFEMLELPPELIGHVMLIGANRLLTAEDVAAEVTRLKAAQATNPSAPVQDWLRMGTADRNGVYRATVEYSSYVDENGLTQVEPSGVIRFNADYIASDPSDSEVVTFGEQDGFVITLVFVDEPASAQNSIQMTFGQGDVMTGAWLVSQTLYACAADGSPDAAKGGDTVAKPIWSDADGNVDGDHQNVHGWLHQPVTGDSLGMSAVINPELGLVGGALGTSVEAVRDVFEENRTVRPFLVWTLIPKAKVPANLFDVSLPAGSASRSDFMRRWALPQWLGGTPSIGDRTTISLSKLRKELQDTAQASTGFYSAAGIIPLTYRGYCAEDRTLGSDPDAQPRASDTLLAFSTMRADELTAALAAGIGLSNEDAALLPYETAIDMTDETLWADGAILRFALVIANTQTDLVYDCQALANFTSDAFSAYCPWYTPDATSNVNRVTSAEDAGISPFAWVYAIEQGGVWLNEVRPFATAIQGSGSIASAVELAMYASPLETGRTDGLYIPTRTLDGWKLVMKYAPMPLYGASKETPLTWSVHREVELKSWVPYRRFKPDYDTTAPGANPNYYDLDYYCATTDVSKGFTAEAAGSLDNNGAYSADTVGSFTWLKLDEELFDKGLEETLRKSETYAGGVVYAIALVRNNGVVADEVIFYNSTDGLIASDTITRVQLAIDSENANRAAAGTVRGITAIPLPQAGSEIASAQLCEWQSTASGTKDIGWIVDLSNTAYNTFPGANVWSQGSYTFTQPKLDYTPDLTTFAMLSAQVVGGDGQLLLTRADGFERLSGRSLTASYLTGTAYTLELSGWNTEWFRLAGVSKNGQSMALPSTAQATTYAVADDGLTLRQTPSVVIDAGELVGDTDYALTFVYTDAAARLAASGALTSQDDDFLAWLLKADPEAILAQTAADGVTASEKYWLGLSSAKVSAQDVALTITSIGLQEEPEGDRLPALAVSLKQGETPIGELKGDGALILLGKTDLKGEWRYLRRLYPEDLNGERYLVVRTDCKFFKAVLLSAAQAEATTP